MLITNAQQIATQLFSKIYSTIFKDYDFLKTTPEKREKRKIMFQEKFTADAKSLAAIAADTIIDNPQQKKEVGEAINDLGFADLVNYSKA